MSQELINVGTLPNDGSGDPLRTAFEKVNNNFTQLFNTGYQQTVVVTTGNVTVPLLEFPANNFTQSNFQINSSSNTTPDSQNITISASISKDLSNVKFVGYATQFTGNALSTFDMDVANGNVRLMCVPLVNDTLIHYIEYQVGSIGTV